MATISVIMGIYNCAVTLPEAINSIVNQTYSDWQLIMCDDGSTDETYEIANSYVNCYPDKMILIKNERNQGLGVALNHCLAVATGSYVARMDGDDISKPKRFEKELLFLKEHPEYSIVSCNMVLFDEAGEWGVTHSKKVPKASDLAVGTPHCHAASMAKKECFDTVHGYSTEKRFLRVEDRNLWYKMYTAGYRGANIEEPLYCMRDNRNAAKRRKMRYRINGARVGLDVVKEFKLGPSYFIRALKPILLGLLPQPIYRLLHRARLHNRFNNRGNQE